MFRYFVENFDSNDYFCPWIIEKYDSVNLFWTDFLNFYSIKASQISHLFFFLIQLKDFQKFLTFNIQKLRRFHNTKSLTTKLLVW